jgi:hypothetical protein
LLAAEMDKSIGEGMMGKRMVSNVSGWFCVDRELPALSGCLESQILEQFPTKILDFEVSNRNS